MLSCQTRVPPTGNKALRGTGEDRQGRAGGGGREQACSGTPPPSQKASPPPHPGEGHLPYSLRPCPPQPTRRVPTFGVEVHAEPGAPTLALEALQVLPDEHVLHLIPNGQDRPPHWTQGRSGSGHRGLPGVAPREPPPHFLASGAEDGVESLHLCVHRRGTPCGVTWGLWEHDRALTCECLWEGWSMGTALMGSECPPEGSPPEMPEGAPAGPAHLAGSAAVPPCVPAAAPCGRSNSAPGRESRRSRPGPGDSCRGSLFFGRRGP